MNEATISLLTALSAVISLPILIPFLWIQVRRILPRNDLFRTRLAAVGWLVFALWHSLVQAHGQWMQSLTGEFPDYPVPLPLFTSLFKLAACGLTLWAFWRPTSGD
mgnify:CR=1 FL=1